MTVTVDGRAFPIEAKSLSIVWSDDCWSCLCNLPHRMETHIQAIERAQAAFESQRQELQRAIHEVEHGEANARELDEEGADPIKKEPCVDGTACKVSDAEHALPL